MSPRGAWHQRVYRALLWLYPTEFRVRFAPEMEQLFGDLLRDARRRDGRAAVAGLWLRTVGDVASTAASERARRIRTMAHSMAASPSASSRILGLAGVLGGAFLLAAFVVDIAPEINIVRLILFNIGAMAIVIGVSRRQASRAPRLALAAAVPAFVANAWYLVMVVFDLGAGGSWPVGFAAGVALWWTDAWFALVTLRLGVVTRVGAAALAIGSALAFLGMDRLGLIGPAPTVIGNAVFVGQVLHGLGWIVLGIDLATRQRGPTPASLEARPAGSA